MLSADQKFLVDLMEKCAVTEKEYKERKESRQEEIFAIGEALGILTGDAARDLFTGTLGFTQLAEKKAAAKQASGRARSVRSSWTRSGRRRRSPAPRRSPCSRS